MSFDFSKLKEIFNETERNLKLIEYQNSKFAVSVLNELRYALRHAIDSDEAKAMAHLQRALFDSYDLLLIYQLDKIKEYEDEFGYYSDCVQLFIPDYADWRARANKAVRLHNDFLQSSDRTSYYGRMKETTALLNDYIEKLEAAKPLWRGAIRRMRTKNALAAIGVFAAVIAAALQGVQLIFR